MGVLPDKMDRVYPDVIQQDAFEENPSRSSPDLYSKNRKPTDVCFLIVFAMFFTVLLFFVGYCMYYGDIARILYGYDHCGSVCGDTPKNNSTETYLQECYKARAPFGPYHAIVPDGVGLLKRVCTDNCSRYSSGETCFKRCLPDEKTASRITKFKYFLVEVSEDFDIYWEHLIHLCALSLALSLVIVLLFRCCVGAMVWVILICVEIACIGAAIASWVLWVQKLQVPTEGYQNEANVWLYLGYAIGATLLSILVGLVIAFMRKKIELVIQLFEEAGKAVASMPGLLLEPLVTFLALAATVACWMYLCLWIASSGRLTKIRENVYYYQKDEFMTAAGFLSVLGLLWLIQFIIGCQHMIVAGAVSKWYFTRDKLKLSSPVTESAYNLTRYHLGSVALGSFLITLIQVLRLIVNTLRNMLKKEDNGFLMCITKACLCLCNCCLSCLEWIVNTFTGNAYIIVAMYGHSFFKAGKQAFARIVAHPLSFAAINSIGDFVLCLAKVLVFVITEATALYLLKDKGIQHLWVFLVLVGLFSIIISHCFITLYEMTIDTIFICFCEDSEMNDGVSKPYYMSRGLMEYVDNSKKALEMHDKKKLYGSKKFKANEIRSVSLDLETKG